MTNRCAIAILMACATSACSGGREYPRQSLETGGNGVAHVDESECALCHEPQHVAWRDSHHDRAMQPATEESVLGDFDDVAFTSDGETIRFYRRDGRFYVHARSAAGEATEHEVKYTFGIEPLQQYLIPMPGGRLQALTVAWDTQRRRWFDLLPAESLEPGDPMHWTGRLNRWNDRCAECHSTDLRVSYEAESDTYRTTWAAMDVGCQACHGPGAAHVAWARSPAAVRAEAADDAFALVVDYRTAGQSAELTNCGRCHSRRSRTSAEDEHGRSFHEDFVLALLREDLYHPDGQILDEVYVLGSFVQSRMYRSGVTCSDCHDPHTARTLASDNSLCTRCHNERPPDVFPTLEGKNWDSPLHHHHESGTPGASCVECHMPARTYMEVDARRDHSLRVPRPDVSVKLGTPDACTGCHTDRSAGWAAEVVAGWFADRTRPGHFGEAIAAGRAGEPEAAAALAELAADTGQAGIVRATAIELLGRYATREAVVSATAATADPDPLIRLAAVNALGALPENARPPVLVPLLSDSMRAVRTAAARQLASMRERLPGLGTAVALDRALSEWRDAQLAQADQPESHHNLGDIHYAERRLAEAERSWQTAIRIDSAFVPARVNLAMLYNEFGRNAEAERLLRESMALAPSLHELHYSLGLLLAEQGRLEEAATELAAAARALPNRPRIHYNLGLALAQTGDADGSETALRRAWQLSPQEPAFVNGLAHFYRDRERWPEATRFARLLVELLPDEAAARQLLDEITTAARGR